LVTFLQNSGGIGYLGTGRFTAFRNLALFGDRIVIDGRNEIGVIITLIKKEHRPFAGSPLPGKALSPAV
jgi:hypothetical protein